MARHDSDREDLLHEATALVERIELKPIDSTAADHVVVGFRKGGALSIFFGSDPVYQFNAAGELRRAFHEGQMYKAVRGRLASLRRERKTNAVQLVRRDLTDAEQGEFRRKLATRLERFTQQLNRGDLVIVGQVPAQADVLGRVWEWLRDNQAIRVADRPNVSDEKQSP